MFRKLYIVIILLISFLSTNSYAEDSTLEKDVKLKIQKIYNLDFSEKDVLILNNIPLNKNIMVKGYSYKKENENLSIKAAKSDLLKNYVAFIKGLDYELNENKLKLIFDDKINLKNIDVKPLTNDIYEASRNLILSDSFVLEYSKQSSVFVFSKSEIKDSVLNAFLEAKNTAIIKGLNEFYINKKQDKIKGKIFFEDIIYNSLDEYNPFQTEIIYVVRFAISND